MAGSFHRRFWVLLITAYVAMSCWKKIPNSTLDRFTFAAISHGSTNPPFCISGNGSHHNPWKLRAFSLRTTINPQHAPAIISLGDDLEGIFQSSPLSPIDFAVILTNMHRLGAHDAATATVLAWDAPDPIGLAALDKAINRFDSLVMTTPLSRGTLPEIMPQSFRRASIPLSAIEGNTTDLPIVNRISLPNVILGSENTTAGFQSLDSESNHQDFPMLARWGDRVVFAFPVVVAMQRLKLPLAGIQIKLGEYIQLSENGPIVPIDRYGRLSLPPPKVAPASQIPAASVIDKGADLVSTLSTHAVILRDDRSAADPSTLEFSTMLPGMIASITSDEGLSSNHPCNRPRPIIEAIYLSIVVILLTGFCKLPTFSRNVVFLVVTAICACAQCIAASFWIWLPGLAAIAAIAAAFAISIVIPIRPKARNQSIPPTNDS